MIMENSEELVKLAARIWRSHHRQEALCKSLMGMEISCKLRKIFSKRHMCSMLFKNEIKQVYESFKCTFSDGELGSITRREDDWSLDDYSLERMIGILIEEQNRLIGFYEMAILLLWEHEELATLCIDHLGRLKELNKMLNLENNIVKQASVQFGEYGIVA
jgi:hypothetical protein